MGFMNFICPNSPTVWDRNGFSTCFENMVLGFGASMMTVFLVCILGFTRRNAAGTKITSLHLLDKVFLRFVPALGACLPLYDMIWLLNKILEGQTTIHDEWFFRCSKFMAWMTIVIFLKCEHWFLIFCNRILCFWWIAKLLLEIPHLQTVFYSLEALRCFKESCSVLVDIMFGVYVNIIRVTRTSSENRTFCSMEDPLLSCDKDSKGNLVGDSDGSTNKYWHLLTFNSINSVLNRGVTKQLDFEDLVQLPTELNPSCHNELLGCWAAEQSKNFTHPSLFRAICYAYGWPYMRLGLLKVLNDCIGFMGPLFLNKLIWYLQQGSGHLDGYIFAVSLGLMSIFKSFLDTQYTFHLSKLKLKLRSSIMTTVFRKCLCVSLAERSKFSEGEIQTFMSIDADRTVNLCNSFHDMWSLPLQIGVALYLLYTQVKFAFVSGIAITILLIPVNKWISTLIASATEKMMKQKDERIRRAGELLTYIRTMKMYGWELLFANRLMETRALEVKHLSTRKYLDAWCVFFWATTPTLFSLFTFGLFTLMGHPLNAATVFTCVALFNTLISPLNSFPWVINGMIDAIISTRRLSKFLSCCECNSELTQQSNERVHIADSSSTCLYKVQDDSDFEHMAVVVRDAYCVWSNSSKEGPNSLSNRITLDLPKGFLIAVIGEVGSGKSSFLNSILGEMRLIHGSICLHGSTAYASQIPWILSGTVRDNILFGKEYDAKRYNEILRACALDVDISLMVRGDLTYIGEKGFNLSGGQRARLALARAVYHGSDIYLLDDVLSAVDAQVACWILHNAVMGPLMDHKTRVLCTHNIQAISSADMIIVMDKGHLKWAGSSTDFLLSPYATIPALKDSKNLPSQILRQKSSTNVSNESEPNLLVERDDIVISEEAQNVTEIELRKEGRVDLSVYKNYAKFSGWPIAILICLSALLMQASRNGNDLWLSYWVDTTTGSHKTMYSTSFYLVILCIFSVVNSLLTLVRAFSFSFGGLRAAVQVHTRLLNELINAPVCFFDQNPSGRLLNRFSSDMYAIDDSLPFIINILLANFISLLGIVIVLSYVQILFLFLLLPFWFIYNKLQFYYRSTSRELRRLDSVSRSPIYASFSETLDGSSTIRAFNAEELFMARFTEHVALYQKTSYSEITASLWLSLRLQLLAAFVIFFIAVMAVIGTRGDLPVTFGTPGLVGLALSYAAPVVSLLSNFLASFTETEKEMVSVERVLQYMDIPQEELQGCQSLHPNWPFQGQIKFEHVTLRYMPYSPAALHDVSFDIAAGMQIGIIGRTGAGKSSVINALFRLSPICSGSILVDGIDVADVAVRDLRSHLAVVPQSPFLFEGLLRDNLDPSGVITDSKIWDALEKCHVKEEVAAIGGLDIHVKEAGISFSVGHRQLICLARALLKSSKVLCLDECTANVDTQTASLLQSTISTECKGMTVITIAHRISVVLEMDGILILDQGILVEQGNPQVLLHNEFSRFSSFAKASTM